MGGPDASKRGAQPCPTGDLKLVVLVTAYRLPNQLARLVHRLESSWPGVRILVHVDSRVDIGPFSDACLGTSAEFVSNRVPVYWGHVSLLEGQMRLLRSAIEQPFDWALLLSGQCYPIRPLPDLARYLASHAGSAFIEMSRISTDWPEQAFRFEQFHMARLAVTAPRLFDFLRRLLKHVSFTRRPPQGVEFYGGSTWWCLRRDAVEAIDRSRQFDGGLRRYFRRVLIPDESYIHTVLMKEGFSDRLAPKITYDRFEPGALHPVVWQSKDLSELLRSGCYFARKFDEDIDAEVLDLLDQIVEPSAP